MAIQFYFYSMIVLELLIFSSYSLSLWSSENLYQMCSIFYSFFMPWFRYKLWLISQCLDYYSVSLGLFHFLRGSGVVN